MTFATRQDVIEINNEMEWNARDVPSTIYQMLSKTAGKFPTRPAISYQILSGPSDKAETLTWEKLHQQVTQAANLFRSLKIEETDVVALVMPNSLETAIAMLGAMVAGIANPVNPLLEPEQISAILEQQESGVATADVCREHGISSATLYKWKANFGGLELSDARKLKALEDENAKLKKLLAEQMLDNAMLRDVASRKW